MLIVIFYKSLHWKMKPNHYFFIQVVCFHMNFLPNHTKRPLPKMFMIRLGLFLEENGLKSVEQLGLWAKSATRQTRICYDS